MVHPSGFWAARSLIKSLLLSSALAGVPVAFLLSCSGNAGQSVQQVGKADTGYAVQPAKIQRLIEKLSEIARTRDDPGRKISFYVSAGVVEPVIWVEQQNTPESGGNSDFEVAFSSRTVDSLTCATVVEVIGGRGETTEVLPMTEWFWQDDHWKTAQEFIVSHPELAKDWAQNHGDTTKSDTTRN
jgi:hypothetical protein